MTAIFTGGVIDGLDGLSGGIFAAIFAAYGGIAYFQNQIDLAAFCGIMMGGILAFLWFNIPPARFYMGETGILGTDDGFDGSGISDRLRWRFCR